MDDTIRNAFKALDEVMDVKIEPIKVTLKEDIDEFEDNDEIEIVEFEDTTTISELFEEEGAYIFTVPFEHEDETYSLFIEGITSTGESCDVAFTEFDVDNIDAVLVEILDSANIFVDMISWLRPEGYQLDVSINEVIDEAKRFLAGEDFEETRPLLDDEEDINLPAVEPDAERQEKIDNKTLTDHSKNEELLEESNSKLFFGDDADIQASNFVEENNITDYKVEWNESEGGLELLWGGALEERRTSGKSKFKANNPLAKLRKEGAPEKFTESIEYDLRDDKELKEAEEHLAEDGEEETIEQIVDIDADNIGKVKKSYMGNAILQCPVCTTFIYRELEELEEPEEEGGLYNKGLACPHCGSLEGFDLVGQVASLDVDPEATLEFPVAEEESEEGLEDNDLNFEEEELESESPEEEELEFEEEEEDKVKITPIEEDLDITSEEEGTKKVFIESLDEERFKHIVERYLKEVYNNIEEFNITGGEVNAQDKSVVVEGKITFKSGKTKDTQFIFEAREINANGRMQFVGRNETFSPNRVFKLYGTLEESKLLSESLSYKYKIEDKQVRGHIKTPSKRK